MIASGQRAHPRVLGNAKRKASSAANGMPTTAAWTTSGCNGRFPRLSNTEPSSWLMVSGTMPMAGRPPIRLHDYVSGMVRSPQSTRRRVYVTASRAVRRSATSSSRTPSSGPPPSSVALRTDARSPERRQHRSVRGPLLRRSLELLDVGCSGTQVPPSASRFLLMPVPDRPRPRASLAVPVLPPLELDHVQYGVDQRQVSEGLREVPKLLAGVRVDLLAVQVQFTCE